MALQQAGVAALIAPSFGRIFFRNSINIGLPAVAVETIDGILEGDTVIVDLEDRVVINERTGDPLTIENLRGTSREILDAGGIVNFTKRRLASKAATGEGR